MNPWFSIWFKPQKTISQIVTENPKRLVPDLAIIAGFAYALNRAFEKSFGDSFGLLAIILTAFLAGAINGWLFLYIASAVIQWTGKWLKGRATVEHIRAALSWANTPMIWSIAIWAIAIIIFKNNLFQSDTSAIDNNATLIVAYGIFSLCILVMQIWAFILIVRCIGKVQAFSLWKSLLNLLMSTLIVFVPIISLLLLASKFIYN